MNEFTLSQHHYLEVIVCARHSNGRGSWFSWSHLFLFLLSVLWNFLYFIWILQFVLLVHLIQDITHSNLSLEAGYPDVCKWLSSDCQGDCTFTSL